MTNRDRYFENYLFGYPDKVLFTPGEARESTLKVWQQQGLPKGMNYMDFIYDELGIPAESKGCMHIVGISFKMIPEYESVILEHKDGHYIVRDWMGAVTEISDRYDPTYLVSARDFVTRKWHKFPVETREDWEEMKKRYDPYTPERISDNAVQKALQASLSDMVLTVSFNGVFWQLREWCGFENLCIKFVEEPEFVHDMAEFWADFVSRTLERFLLYSTIDRVMIREDMAFKAHGMISPEMTREFIQPAYKKWVKQLKNHGCRIIDMDCDGYIEELIPIWIESGINCCTPIEVAAHNDICKYRDLFGRRMAYHGGIDKRIIAQGGRALEDHVMSIVPHMFKCGGYVPGCDHGVPPDISWTNFREYARLLAKLCGWI